MVLLALLAATVVSTAPATAPRPGPVVQATATVRIISGSRVTLGAEAPEAQLRSTEVKNRDGQSSPARLVEFP